MVPDDNPCLRYYDSIMTSIPALQRAIAKTSALQSSMQALQTSLQSHATTLSAIQSSIASIDASSVTTVVKTADQLDIGSSFADITELGFALSANTTYYFRFVLIMDADATTTSIDVAISGPASPSVLNYTKNYWTSGTVQAVAAATAYDSDTNLASSNGSSPRMFLLEGIVRTASTTGNLRPRAKRGVTGNGPNCRAGSFGILRKLT